MTCPLVFPSNLNVSLDFASGNIELLGKQNGLFPSGPVIKCLLLPFQDQRSADRVRKDISNSLEAKKDVNVKPVFTSRKVSQTLSVKENEPPIVNTHRVVYLFQCDLGEAN